MPPIKRRNDGANSKSDLDSMAFKNKRKRHKNGIKCLKVNI